MHLRKPWEKVLCPYCFKQFDPSDCPIFSEKDGTVIEAAPTGLTKLTRKVIGQRLSGDVALKLPRLQCPGCSHPWPKDIELAENYIVALVGGTGAGKSNYIAMAIDQLKNHTRTKKAMRIARIGALSSDVERRYNNYYQSLIQDKKALPLTPLASARGGITEPLIYRLDFQPGAEERGLVYLYLYDVAGEDITDQNNALDYARFLFFANALILLADPFAMPNMRKYIHPQYHPPKLPDVSPTDVLFRVVDLYEERVGGKLSIPIAITVSKSDLLQFADPPRRSSLFMTPAYADPRFTEEPLHPQEFEQVSGDVQKLLQVYGDADLVTWTQQYEQVGFFAVSATGWPPDPQTGLYPAIEPLRVLDPLLWALYRLGVLQEE